MAVAPPNFINEKTKIPWWKSNKKLVTNYIKQAKTLVSSTDENDVAYALQILNQALVLSPGNDVALDLKARSLLYLRRFNDVVELLQDYIPSAATAAAKTPSPGSFSSAASFSSISSISSTKTSRQLGKERVRLLPSRSFHHLSESKHLNDVVEREPPRCFSIADLRNRITAGMRKKCDKEGQWRYLILGQALCHLGLMEDAMILLQISKRLAFAAFRRESICRSDDSFSTNFRTVRGRDHQIARPRTDTESITLLITHIKVLLRRKAAAMAALDAGLYTESIRYLTKILESRRFVPRGFLAECYMNRASAYKSAGRLAESISDSNRTLALDPTCIEALILRASILETLRCLPDCLHDLEHLKLLYNSILRDRKLPGPIWKHRHTISYREILTHSHILATKIQKVKNHIASGDQAANVVDYYALIGLNRGCSKSELQRSHLLVSIKHKPDKSISFLENCEFADDCDIESAKDRAKLSALMLYRLLQKGYKNVMASINIVEKESQKCQATNTTTKQHLTTAPNGLRASSTSVFQGVFCREVAVVGSLVSQAAGCNR